MGQQGLIASGTFHSYTPRYTIDYHLTDANLLNASAAKGEQAGGFNVIGSYQPSTETYGPDYNWTYEIGSKNKFFDDRNASLGLTAKHWDVQFWIRNLTDLKYVASVIVGQPNMQYNSYLADRETLGVTAKFRY